MVEQQQHPPTEEHHQQRQGQDDDQHEEDDDEILLLNKRKNDVYQNLCLVESILQNVINEHETGTYGYITREWGFMAPGGLGTRLGGKFVSYELKLWKCQDYFWPQHLYDTMEEKQYGTINQNVLDSLATEYGVTVEGEQIYNNNSLHEYLKIPPEPSVELDENSIELHDYRTAAKIFLLLGTLSHLYGNSAPNNRLDYVQPTWIEQPLLIVAKRLQIEPTLSGHFLVQENWIFKDILENNQITTTSAAAAAATVTVTAGTTNAAATTTSTTAAVEAITTSTTTTDAVLLLKNNYSPKNVANESNRILHRRILYTILQHVICDDRRYRVKIYPNCFIGQQLIDVLIDNGYASSRIEAVRIGRAVNQRYNLFKHVTNDHPLMDKHLFYRYTTKWLKKIHKMKSRNSNSNNGGSIRLSGSFGSASGGGSGGSFDITTGIGGCGGGVDGMMMIPPAEALKEEDELVYEDDLNDTTDDDLETSDDDGDGADDGVDANVKKSKRKKKKSESTARLLRPTDLLRSRSGGSAPTRTSSGGSATKKSGSRDSQLGRTSSHSASSVHSSCSSDDDNDSFIAGNEASASVTKKSKRSSFHKRISTTSITATTTMNAFANASSSHALRAAAGSDSGDSIFTSTHLSLHNGGTNQLHHSNHETIMATIAVMGMVPVKDRRYRFRVYKQCFVASQLIDILIEQECATSRKDATQLALSINQRFNLFEHVVDDHQIKDEYLFFRFTKKFQQLLDAKKTNNNNNNGSIIADDNGGGNNNNVQKDNGDDDKSKDLGGQFSGTVTDLNLTTPEPSSTKTPSEPTNKAGARESITLEEALAASQKTAARVNFASHTRTVGPDLKFVSVTPVPKSESSLDDDTMFGVDDEAEFRFDTIEMLYPAFGHNHEKVNQLIPACMGHAFASLPFDVLDIITTMRNILEADMNASGDTSSVDSYESQRLYDLLYKVAFSASRCKEEFQQMSTDPTKRTFNSKHISIRQTQPFSNGVIIDGKRRKGTTGTQFPYFHLLDWLLGRFQYNDSGDNGLVAEIAAVDDTYTRPEREYIRGLSKLNKASTLRGFMDLLGRPKGLLTAYNHLMECYAGEGGVLQAHCRKLYSYIHNDVQFSTAGTNHLKSKGQKDDSNPAAGCPMSKSASNHIFATMMFKHMRKAADDRWKLRIAPLMTEVGKVVYSTSESGGFLTVALDLVGSGLRYEYGDVVKVLLPNDDRTTFAWTMSLSSNDQECFTLKQMEKLYKDTGNGWGWAQLWEALGWDRFEEAGGEGVPLETIARYIEQGQICDESGKCRWVNCPLALVDSNHKMFPVPPSLTLDMVASLEPVSPRVYSVSGVEVDRVFLLVSKPQDGATHHGYDGMSNCEITKVHCSFSPATFFLVPPREVNLVCIASGTGISPFVGLADAIGSRPGTYTITHQCKSSDLFLANSQTWLDFTCINPGACVMGYISGDRSRRNCPMRYIIRNGEFEETTVLRRHNASAYFFECSMFQSRIKETYKNGGLNLAYCCGGVKSAITPMRDIADKEGMTFEFTCECYGVPPTLTKDSLVSQVGGTIVDLNQVSPIHPGGDQILHQLNDLALEANADKTPDHSLAFWELHPHAYNLHRCLRTPLDADSEAFAAFLKRQHMRESVVASMAAKYAEVALQSPKDSKVVRIATELQSTAIRQQLSSGDAEGAKTSAAYLEALLNYVPDADRWNDSLNGFHTSLSNSGQAEKAVNKTGLAQP